MLRVFRRSLALGAVVATAVAVTACGSSESEPGAGGGGPVELTYFTFSAAPDHLEDLDTIVAGFEKENPNVDVEVQTSSYDTYATKLQTRLAGGQAPDTFELEYQGFVQYAKAGRLLDLAGAGTVDASRYDEGLFERFALDGKQYGLPATFSNVLLFYNKDLLREAGVAEPTPDWTWEDEMAAAKRLTRDGTWGAFQPVSFYEFYKALAQSGGEFFDASGTKAAFNSPAGVQALEFLVGKVHEGVMPTEEEMGGLPDDALFKKGKIALWHNGIWQLAAMKDAPFEWDIVVEPGNTQDATAVFSNGVVASADTEHPKEALAWLEYLASSPVTVKTRIASSWELPAIDDEQAFADYLEQRPPENRQAVFDALEHAVAPPVVADQKKLEDIMNGWFSKAVTRDVSVREALARSAAEVDALLAEQ